ncbi:hypothetical protein B0H13DRAFT_2325219 [Mycena leptocephala]|nr:hypothetical protein B0H13DRAFT_2325219 [Mycena leptocephala]
MRITLDLPLAVRQTPTFSVVGTFVLSTSEPRPRTPRTAPAPRLQWTVTWRPPACASIELVLARTTLHPRGACPPRLPSQSLVRSPESV